MTTKIIKKSVAPFSAVITIGLEEGYSGEKISKQKVISCIQEYQDKLIEDFAIFLSAKITECEIVMSGQVEPHLSISFINYPKFSLEVKNLKSMIINLAEILMDQFYQNRVVIEFNDETIMLEVHDEIDPRIKKY